MIRHIVMWKLKEFPTSGEKDEADLELRRRQLDLEDSIPEIRSIEVGINSSLATPSNYEVVLISEFDSLEDLRVYQEHPEHKKLVDFLQQIRIHRVAIDFEKN